jgi:hypothetical protein
MLQVLKLSSQFLNSGYRLVHRRHCFSPILNSAHVNFSYLAEKIDWILVLIQWCLIKSCRRRYYEWLICLLYSSSSQLGIVVDEYVSHSCVEVRSSFLHCHNAMTPHSSSDAVLTYIFIRIAWSGKLDIKE